MVRKIIKIDEEKCNGCGACADACHEGAIVMEGGKAKLIRDDYCDGLGNCLPACPTDAISFEEREAAAFDEKAVKRHLDVRASGLGQWPVQIQLIPVTAPYFQDADLLIAADCTAYAHAKIHDDFMQGRVTVIGCPKLDAVDYAEKLAAVFENNAIKSITLLRMEVPCCGGLEWAAREGLKASGKEIPLHVITVKMDGSLQDS